MARQRNKFVGGHSPLKNLAVRIVLLLVLVAAQPFLWRVVASAANSVHQKRSERQQIGDVQGRIQQIRQNKDTQKELLDQLKVVVPIEDALLTIIERLQLLADPDHHNVQLLLQGIERQAKTENTAPSSMVPFSINVIATGRISNVLSYLHRLEHLQELVVVRSISLVPAATLPSSNFPLPTVLPSPLPGATPFPAVNTEPIYAMTLNLLFFFQPLNNNNATQ